MDKIQKKDHFYLIDGSGYIFRAYYALPPLSRKSDGLPTGAVSGFCSMLFKLLEDSKSNQNLQKPTHFAVIFDSARKTFRNEIYSDYKANRAEAPDDLAPQFEYIRKSVLAFNLPSVELLNYEADDLIATYAEKILKKGAKVTIVSSDKDLMQLYKKNVRIYDPMKNKFISEDDIIKKFGVNSSKVIDVQALAGDSSDNVPGVPGIGVKTAAELINKYGNLEKLLQSAHEIKQNKRRETLIENKEKALISKKLVTLKNDAPVNKNLEEFKLKDIDKDKLYNFLREMEFNRLLSSAISAYGEPNLNNIKKEEKFQNQKPIEKKDYFLISKLEQIDEWIKEAEETGDNTGIFEGSFEYITLTNATTVGVDGGEHDGNDYEVESLLTDMGDDGYAVIVLQDSVDGVDAVRVQYNDTDALQASTEIGAQLDTITHTGTVDLDSDTYEADDMATITIVDADLNQDSFVRDTYENSSTTFNISS